MKQSADSEALDVVLLGFESRRDEPPAVGLCRVFGIQERAASHILANLPATVQRGVSRVRAAYFVRALALIGGRAQARDGDGTAVELDTSPPADATPFETQHQQPGARAQAQPSEARAHRIAPTHLNQAKPRPVMPAAGRGPAATVATYAQPGSDPPAQPEPGGPGPEGAGRPGPAGGSANRTLVWGGLAGANPAANSARPATHPTAQAHTPRGSGAGAPDSPGAAVAFGSAAEGGVALACAVAPVPANPGLPKHASTLSSNVLDVTGERSDGNTRMVLLGDSPQASAGTPSGAKHEGPTTDGFLSDADVEGWRGLPEPVLDAAEIQRRWPRSAPSPRSKTPGAPQTAADRPVPVELGEHSDTGISLGGDARAPVAVMDAWELPSSATAQRYQHPMVPRGKPIASPRDGHSDGIRQGPSAGPSYMPPSGMRPGQTPIDAPFWQSIGHGLSVPFMGAGTLWIVGLCAWSLIGGALSAAAGRLPDHLITASVLVLGLASVSLVAFAADFFRACFWAVLEGKDEVDRAPSADPGRFLDQYVMEGLHLAFFALAGILPTAAWSLAALRGSSTAIDLMRSPITWALLLLPVCYWPMALGTTAIGHRFGAVWMIGNGLMGIIRAPLAYLAVVAIGLVAFALAGAVFGVIGVVTNQHWIFVMGAGFPLAVTFGVQGALMGHLVRANPDVFD